jgi:hypothetical protein
VDADRLRLQRDFAAIMCDYRTVLGDAQGLLCRFRRIVNQSIIVRPRTQRSIAFIAAIGEAFFSCR